MGHGLRIASAAVWALVTIGSAHADLSRKTPDFGRIGGHDGLGEPDLQRFLREGGVVRPEAPLVPDTRQDAEAIFERYARAEEKAIQSLEKALKEAQELYKDKKSPPDPTIITAVVTEYRRLLKSRKQTQEMKGDALKKREQMAANVDGIVNLQFTDMLAAYASDLNKYAAKGEEDGKKLDAMGMKVRAGRDFAATYSQERRQPWAFDDERVQRLSAAAVQLKPFAEKLLAPQSNETIFFRVKFFDNWSANLVKNNRKEVDEFRQDLEQQAAEIEKQQKALKEKRQHALPPAPRINKP
jgi:hypothetical protein